MKPLPRQMSGFLDSVLLAGRKVSISQASRNLSFEIILAEHRCKISLPPKGKATAEVGIQALNCKPSFAVPTHG